MSWTALPHTADVALEIVAATPEDLYGEAVRALTDTITDVAAVEPRETRTFEVEASAPDLLLVEVLQAALELFEVERLLVSRADAELATRDAGTALRATVAGERFDPARHPQKVAVKAVTYHDLRVERGADGWRARVVLDI